mmetsp:Transcript_28255/g.76560  ORF Transcript_28255/g.76560 Transcript_28255/m.76560 type:complete len:290 (-) Transcript_28255:499-1368(-)
MLEFLHSLHPIGGQRSVSITPTLFDGPLRQLFVFLTAVDVGIGIGMASLPVVVLLREKHGLVFIVGFQPLDFSNIPHKSQGVQELDPFRGELLSALTLVRHPAGQLRVVLVVLRDHAGSIVLLRVEGEPPVHLGPPRLFHVPEKALDLVQEADPLGRDGFLAVFQALGVDPSLQDRILVVPLFKDGFQVAAMAERFGELALVVAESLVLLQPPSLLVVPDKANLVEQFFLFYGQALVSLALGHDPPRDAAMGFVVAVLGNDRRFVFPAVLFQKGVHVHPGRGGFVGCIA